MQYIVNPEHASNISSSLLDLVTLTTTHYEIGQKLLGRSQNFIVY